MKKAFKINLSGQIFHIDEDAYEKLKNYLDTISSHFSDAHESKEILSDIENRIAELFTEKIKDDNQVITIKDVDEIIEIMGRPEEIASDEDEGESKRSERRGYRRLYRDPDNTVIGGVCSGLGAYFNIDTIIFRILFIVLVLVGWGLPVILYIVLWIAVPKARTAAEKLEMKGEKVTVSNIEKTIREEYDNVRENFKKARGSETFKRTEGFLTELLRIAATVLLAFVKIILVVVAIGFILAGIGILTGLIAFLFFGSNILPFEVFNSLKFDFISPFFNPVNVSLLVTSIMVLVLIPIITIVYGLFKALFRFRANDKALGLSAFALWILALITAISLIVFEARNYREYESISHTHTINLESTGKVSVMTDMKPGEKSPGKESFTIDNKRYLLSRDGQISGTARVGIERSASGNYEIRVNKEARGTTEDVAEETAGSISYSYTTADNTIALSPYFLLPEGEKWRLQHVKVTVFIPEGDTIILDKNLTDHLEGIKNTAGLSARRIAGKTWVMTKEGLEEVTGDR